MREGMSYAEELLQKLLRAIEVYIRDAAIASKHPVHGWRHILPILLCLGVEYCLILHNVTHLI